MKKEDNWFALCECCYCHEPFFENEKVDGYDQGFTVGFLCPKCGKNIKLDLDSISDSNLKCHSLLLYAPLAFLLLGEYTMIMYLIFIFFLISIIMMIEFYFKKDFTEPKPIATIPVPQNKSSG